MANLDEIVAFLDESLNLHAIRDYPGAVNGLQIENSGTIRQVVAAVDASLPVIEQAAASGPGTLMIVHHGMFWQGVQTITGPLRRKIMAAFNADLALYSAHLPLDVHPDLGNNILLARAIGIAQPTPLGDAGDALPGLCGRWNGTRDELLTAVGKAVGGPPHHCPGGPANPANVAVITGGAGTEVAKVAQLGIDTFITGEGPHWSYPLAEELGINLIYAGHYATETFGVHALADRLACHFDLSSRFIDHPTGL